MLELTIRLGLRLKNQMTYRQNQSQEFARNRAALGALLRPNSLVVVNSNDNLPSNDHDGFLLRPGADLFHFSGVEQEESILLLYPKSRDERCREILFIRHASPLTQTWEGRKLTKDGARNISGVERVEWTSEFRAIFHRLMRHCAHVYLNSEAQFINEARRKYPLHNYHSLEQLIDPLRAPRDALTGLSGRVGANRTIDTTQNPQYT